MRDRIGEIKARLSVSAVIGQVVAWDRRKSNPARGDFWACCPFHQEKTPSFHADDRRGFFKCFGCGESGDQVDFREKYFGETTREAIDKLAAEAGIGPDHGAAPSRPARAPAPPPPEDMEGPRRRLRLARKIWWEAEARSDLLMDYLAARGVALEALERTWGGLPPAIRLHPELEHRDQATGRVIHAGPAMVARIGRADEPAVGVHRTWITAQGRARLNGEKIPKQWLGLSGHMMGAPVDLTAGALPRLVVGEGIETTLAAWAQLALAALDRGGPPWAAEAALSLGALTGGALPEFRAGVSAQTGRPLPSAVPDMSRPGWLAPDHVEDLIILADTSEKDADAARRQATCALRRHRFRSDGRPRRARLLTPPGGWGTGRDFADHVAGVVA